MQKIYADQLVSISDFKTNPAAFVAQAQGGTLAVMNHNKVMFYAVAPETLRKLLQIDEADQFALQKIVAERLSRRSEAVDVDPKDL